MLSHTYAIDSQAEISNTLLCNCCFVYACPCLWLYSMWIVRAYRVLCAWHGTGFGAFTVMLLSHPTRPTPETLPDVAHGWLVPITQWMRVIRWQLLMGDPFTRSKLAAEELSLECSIPRGWRHVPPIVCCSWAEDIGLELYTASLLINSLCCTYTGLSSKWL